MANQNTKHELLDGSPDPGDGSRRPGRAIRYVALILIGAVVLVVAVFSPSLREPFASPLASTGLLAVLVLLAIAVCRRARPEHMSLAIAFIVVPYVVLLAVIPHARDIMNWRGAEDRAFIWVPHHELGWCHRPSGVGCHKTREFSVAYSIDDEGCRTTPSPPQLLGEIWLLGGSLTFGHGVQDNECYPALLATRYWMDYRVRNYAVMGWGTGQAYLLLRKKLVERPLPKLVIYGWIDHHLCRNYRSREWLREMYRRGMSNPHFEIENGHLAYKGLAGLELGLPESKSLLDREVRVSIGLLGEMKALCAKHEVPFFLVWLQRQEARGPAVMYAAIHEHGIAVIDASKVSSDYYAIDGHPTRTWHAGVAQFLADSEIVDALCE